VAVLGVVMSSWMMRDPDRAIWDASTPLLMAAGAAAGPAAPLLLVVAGRSLAWVGASRQTWRLAAANDGVMALKWGLVGLVMANLEPGTNLTRSAMIVAAAGGIGVLVNFPLMAAGVRYLYGEWPSQNGRWRIDFVDWAASLIVAVIAATSPVSVLGCAALLVLGVTQSSRVAIHWRGHVQAVFLEVQAAIVAAEETGRRRGHTLAVVEMVDRLTLDRSPAERRSLIRAAWLHALVSGQSDSRCNGVNLDPELSYSARSIALLGVTQRRRLLPRAGVRSRSAHPDAQLIAAACAHAEHPVVERAVETGHLVFMYGITPKIAARVVSCSTPNRDTPIDAVRSIPGG
jgi:hypothetical protein